MRRSLALLVVLLAAPAEASIYWASSFDSCVTPTSTDTNYFSTVTGSPTIVTTNVDTLPGGTNRCALQFSPASGAAAYVVPVISGISAGVTPLNVTANVRITASPANAWRELLPIGDPAASGHYTRGCLLAQKYSGTILGVRYYTLGVFYGDTTSTVCSGSTLNGKRCTPASVATDCPYAGNPNEPQCSVATLASSPIIAENTNILVTLQQTTGTGATAGTVTCAFWQGAAGTSPAAFSRGSQSRVVGYCAAGANAAAPCNVNSECPASTCTLTDVVAAKQVAFGSTDTAAASATYQFDWASVYSGTEMPNGYLETLDLTGTSTADANSNWDALGSAHSCAAGSEHACVNDVGASDGNDSAIQNNNASSSKPTIGLQFANPATPSPLATPKAVVVEMIAQDTAGSGSNSITVDLEQTDGSSTSTVYTPFDFEGFAGTGGVSDPYYPALSSLWEQSWTITKLNALEASINKTAGGGDNGRISTLVAGVLYQTANPAVPTTIPDRDQDGETTVCFISDSLWDNIDFKNALAANLVQPTNLYFYTRGGAKLGDVEGEYASIVEGAASFLGLEVFRGTSGRTCDVVLLSMTSTESRGGYSTVDPKGPTANQGLSQAGFCEDQGGPQQGDPCWCDEPLSSYTSDLFFESSSIPNANYYCITSGVFQASCSLTCFCNTNADCTYGMRTPGPVHTPGPCNTTGHYCVGAAAVGSGSDFTSPPSQRNQFCQPGCINSAGCPTGVCRRSPTRQTTRHVLERITTLNNARPTPAATPPVGGKPILIYTSSPQVARGNAGTDGWSESYPLNDAFHNIYLTTAKNAGAPFVDLWSRFRRNCVGNQGCDSANNCTATEDATKCYRDFGHWTYKGQALLAAPMIGECLTNLGGTHDGTCASGVCQTGLSGDTCSTAADCDTWSCDFATAP